MSSKLVNTYKQFGFRYVFKAVLKRLLAPLLKTSEFYILAVEEHSPTTIPPLVKVYSNNSINELLQSQVNIPEALKRQISNFINESTLIVYLDDLEVCGWGFVQTKGISDYARYKYYIPQKTQLLKNLYVNPVYRGRSIGKIINEQRLNCIPTSVTPTVFVMVSNKYAIRNLKMYGFEIQLKVKDTLWFNKIHKRKITIIKPGAISDLIKSGFKDEN